VDSKTRNRPNWKKSKDMWPGTSQWMLEWVANWMYSAPLGEPVQRSREVLSRAVQIRLLHLEP
jgi:hypothetical protein